MKAYNCEICNFSSNLNSDLKRHLNTNKHKNNEKDCEDKKSKICKISSKIPPKPSKMSNDPPKSLQNRIKVYVCDNCGKEFSRKDNLKRHSELRCKQPKEDNIDYKQMFLDMKDEFKKEKLEYGKQINLLLEKVGNTTNITQNIQLNSYGNEDVSHITDSLKNDMLKIPFSAIPKMIEAVHFNDLKPENKNISLSNIRDNKVKIYMENGWVYKDKEETINDLVTGKYLILDNHYQTILDKINEVDNLELENTQIFEQFKSYFNLGDKALVEKLKKDCELILFNNR